MTVIRHTLVRLLALSLAVTLCGPLSAWAGNSAPGRTGTVVAKAAAGQAKPDKRSVRAAAGKVLPVAAVHGPSIQVERGYSRLINLPRSLKRVSMADDKVADVLVISPRQLYINGLLEGSTNLTVWDRKERVMLSLEIHVGRNLTRLKESLATLLPGEKIEVRELAGAVILSGTASSPRAREKAESVARTFEKERLTNLIDVVGHRQIRIKLTFAEVNRQALNRFNFNVGYFDTGGGFLFSFLEQLTSPKETSIGVDTFTIQQNFSNNLGGMFGFNIGGVRLMGFLDILKQNGMAKVLAEPTLVCLSGEKGDFLAGGEFPIPVPGQNYTTIEFKKYGVQLEFTPEITRDGKIKLLVSPEVSDLDYSAAVVTGGFTVPGLTTRRASTQLVLRNGQGFAIAGLFKRDVAQTVSKWPWLGDIPILGALFRSRQFQLRETDLVIAVTPVIVKPEDMSEPLIDRAPPRVPGDWEFFLSGKDWFNIGSAQLTVEGGEHGLEGGFGHDLSF